MFQFSFFTTLTRIFRTDRDEEVAKPDETRQAKILTQGCVSTHCSSQNQSLTQYSSDFPASAVDRYEIFGLILSRAIILFATLLLLSGCALIDMNGNHLGHFHTVVLDPGHGGYDSGARAVSGLPEKNLTLDVANRTKPLLEARGYHVIMTRTQDVFIPLGVRTAIANQHSDAIFVSIHFNCSPSSAAHGIETYYYNWPSERLAASILRQLIPVYHAHERGVKKATYFVLHHNQRPATLLELGFVSNRNENATIQKPATRQELAERITQGIADCQE